MPTGNNFTITSNAKELGEVFALYLKYNLRDIQELAKKKGASLGHALFKATPKATLSDIRAKVQSLGWAVHRKYRVKRKKGESTQQALERMQNSIIAARFASQKFEASGWLPAVYKFGGSDNAPQGKMSNPNQRGFATIKISDSECSIELVNSSPGIATLEDAKPYLETAINAEIDDMLKYIARKQRQNATLFNRSGKA